MLISLDNMSFSRDGSGEIFENDSAKLTVSYSTLAAMQPAKCQTGIDEERD